MERKRKGRTAPIAGEEMPAKMCALPIGSWNRKKCGIAAKPVGKCRNKKLNEMRRIPPPPLVFLIKGGGAASETMLKNGAVLLHHEHSLFHKWYAIHTAKEMLGRMQRVKMHAKAGCRHGTTKKRPPKAIILRERAGKMRRLFIHIINGEHFVRRMKHPKIKIKHACRYRMGGKRHVICGMQIGRIPMRNDLPCGF